MRNSCGATDCPLVAQYTNYFVAAAPTYFEQDFILLRLRLRFSTQKHFSAQVSVQRGTVNGDGR